MAELVYYLNKRYDQTFTINFLNGPKEISEDGYKFKINKPIDSITKITSFSDQTSNETSKLYFKKYFKYKNNDKWSELIDIENITGITISPCSPFDLELYYFKVNDGDNSNNSLLVDNIVIDGEYLLTEFDSKAMIPDNEGLALLSSVDIYKIFSLSNYQVISNHNNYEIFYRFTQDDGRSYTDYKRLTIDNIKSTKLNPLRFAKVQYLIKNLSNTGLIVYDVILEGDFQNISANYLKTNRYGLKADCISSMQSTPGMPGSSTIDRDFYTSCLSSYLTRTDVTQLLNNENSLNNSSLLNPYQTDKIVPFYNMLVNNTSNILGWTVDYYLTDPDSNGIDTYLHEYTLKNTVAHGKIKVIVPDNKFPIETLIVNQFNLNFFDTFEINITKDEFKRVFGIDKRPSQEDFIYICEANMLFTIKHAQAVRTVMNASAYYKIILEKYEQRTNVRNALTETKEIIDNLTKNTTLDDLSGVENKKEENKIANKNQTFPTSFDKIKYKFSSKLNFIQNKIFIGDFDVIHSYYDLSYTYLKGKPVITYINGDNKVIKSDNRSIICWAKFLNTHDENKNIVSDTYKSYNIPLGVEFNLLDNYDNVNNSGYKLLYMGDKLQFKFNTNNYTLNEKLLTNVWYSFVINFDQQHETLSLNIYKRNATINVLLINPSTYQMENVLINSDEYNNLINNGYKPVNNIESDSNTDVELIKTITYNITPDEFEHENNIKLLGSNIYYTNLRLLNDVIPGNQITNVLKENILRDEQYLIFADNATKKIITTNYWNRNFK
jgi:hypothetical protein